MCSSPHQSISSFSFSMTGTLCKVCQEPAAGYHFGAFTCEGCKSFFGRTHNSKATLEKCDKGGKCDINKKNRTSCKSCRLNKCISVGMSKSASRYGRRSNWFKLHCVEKDKLENSLFNENKDIVAQYKSKPTRSSSVNNLPSNGDSPNSSESSRSISSPYSTIFDTNKSSFNNHLHPHHNALLSNSFDLSLLSRCNNPLSSPSSSNLGSQLPLSPVSPLSPHPTSKFLFHSTASLLTKGLYVPKLLSNDLSSYSRLVPIGFNGHPHVYPPSTYIKIKDDGTSDEQSDPIDLSIKSITHSSDKSDSCKKLSSPNEDTKTSSSSPSLTSPTNQINEENNNICPIDLTVKTSA